MYRFPVVADHGILQMKEWLESGDPNPRIRVFDTCKNGKYNNKFGYGGVVPLAVFTVLGASTKIK